MNTGGQMTDETQKKKEVTFDELVVSAIAANDALAKLLIA